MNDFEIVWVAVWYRWEKGLKQKGSIPLWNLPSSSSMSKSSGSCPWHGRHAISVKSKRTSSGATEWPSRRIRATFFFFDPVSLLPTLSDPVSPCWQEPIRAAAIPWDTEDRQPRDEPPSILWPSGRLLTFELLPVVMGISVRIFIFIPLFNVILLDGPARVRVTVTSQMCCPFWYEKWLGFSVSIVPRIWGK